MTHSQSDPNEIFKRLADRIAQEMLDTARVTTLREVRRICEKALGENPLSAETMTAFLMALISVVAVVAPVSAQEEGSRTLAAMTMLFEYAATQTSWNPAAGGNASSLFTKTNISDTIRQQLNDLDI